MKVYIISILFLCLLASIDQGESLRCYSCNSHMGQNCLDKENLLQEECDLENVRKILPDIKENFSKTNPLDYSKLKEKWDEKNVSVVCVTVVLTEPRSGNMSIARQCDIDKIFSQDKCTFIKEYDTSNYQIECHQCTNDLCNNASQTPNLSSVVHKDNPSASLCQSFHMLTTLIFLTHFYIKIVTAY